MCLFGVRRALLRFDKSPSFTISLPPPPVSYSPGAFPQLMHINPSMSEPVLLRRNKDGLAPGAIAFAGAEFVVLGKTVVGVEEVWEVVFEVICVNECLFIENKAVSYGNITKGCHCRFFVAKG